ncbi:MAG: MFS transporter [Muribaculaceae bacterium]|nr:MFS transporter [Roseburia sp.]MCM1430548.1 MFS transporter [Muribaculaceae bacterium]MCM1492655.1 MFS transporter [Muribaculaceae bacterium]
MMKNIKLNYIYNFIKHLNMQSCIWVLYLGYMGMSLTQIGLLEGIYHATSIVFEVPSGAVADIFGRKRTMLAGRLCVLVSCLLMLFGRSFFPFALSFLVQAFGENLNSGSEEALVYDSMKQSGREEEYLAVCGKTNTIVEISQALATVLGGVLAEYSYFACYVTAALLAALAVVPLLLMREPKLEADSASLPMAERVKTHFKTCFEILSGNRKLTRWICFFNVMEVAATVLFFYSQEYYHSMGLNKIEISMIMLAVGLLSTAGAFFSDRIYRRMGEWVIVIAAAAIFLSIGSYIFYKLWVSVSCFCVCNFMSAMLYPIRSTRINSLIPSGQRATLISVDSLVFSVGMVIIFPAAGWMIDRF